MIDPSSDGEIAYLLLLTLYWHQLRCISFSLSSLNNVKSKHFPNYLQVLAYSFYLPCFFFGPIIIYTKLNVTIFFKLKTILILIFHFFHFQEAFKRTNLIPLRQRLLTLSINLIRYFFWMFLTEFILHFVYINMFLQNIKVCFLFIHINIYV